MEKNKFISTLRALKKFNIVASGIHIKIIKLTHGSSASYICVKGKKKSSQSEICLIGL